MAVVGPVPVDILVPCIRLSSAVDNHRSDSVAKNMDSELMAAMHMVAAVNSAVVNKIVDSLPADNQDTPAQWIRKKKVFNIRTIRYTTIRLLLVGLVVVELLAV